MNYVPTAGGTALTQTGVASPIALSGLTPGTQYSGPCAAAGGGAGSAAPVAHPARTDAQQKQAHDLRFQARSIMLSVAQMAQKYDGPFSQREKWATDI